MERFFTLDRRELRYHLLAVITDQVLLVVVEENNHALVCCCCMRSTSYGYFSRGGHLLRISIATGSLPCLIPWSIRFTCNPVSDLTWPSEHRGDEPDLEGGAEEDGSGPCPHEDGRVAA